MTQADMNEGKQKQFFRCYELFYRTGKNLPDDIRVKYYDALMEYGIYGTEPTDPIILSLLQGAIYSMEKSEEATKKKSEAGKNHTGNQYTKGDTKWKAQKNTVEQNGTQWNTMEQNGTMKNKENKENNIITSKDVIVDESTEGTDYEILYETYPFKGKGIDKEACDKLIDKQLEQGATLNGMLKEMKLEGLELRIIQGTTYRYGKKLEKRLREYVEGMADSEDRLKKLLVEHRKRLEDGPPYKKNPRDELCELFGSDYVKKLFMETKQGIRLFTT